MNDEIKEILKDIEKGVKTGKDKNDIKVGGICYEWQDLKIVLDYITNLQQENEELKKKLDRRYYKNEYERIKQENERLKENNSNMQEEMARVWEENEDNLRCIKSLKEQLESVIKNNQELLEKWHKNNDKIVNLISENERLKDIVVEKDNQIKEMILQKTDYTAVNILEMKLEDYKSRCEKAIEYLDNVETLAKLDGKIIFSSNIFRNILQNGSEEK